MVKNRTGLQMLNSSSSCLMSPPKESVDKKCRHVLFKFGVKELFV